MDHESRQEVFAFLHRLGIAYTVHEHPAVYTCEEAALYDSGEGADCKNLLLTDGQGAFVLAVLGSEQRLNIKALYRALGMRTLRFAPAEDLLARLGLTPGSVTPFGLLRDTQRQVLLAMEEALLHSDKIKFHPNDNTATIVLDTADFLRAMGALGYEPRTFSAQSQPI